MQCAKSGWGALNRRAGCGSRLLNLSSISEPCWVYSSAAGSRGWLLKLKQYLKTVLSLVISNVTGNKVRNSRCTLEWWIYSLLGKLGNKVGGKSMLCCRTMLCLHNVRDLGQYSWWQSRASLQSSDRSIHWQEFVANEEKANSCSSTHQQLQNYPLGRGRLGGDRLWDHKVEHIRTMIDRTTHFWGAGWDLRQEGWR